MITKSVRIKVEETKNDQPVAGHLPIKFEVLICNYHFNIRLTLVG